ncbi:hypothetical protein CLIB1444_10S00188 [[Candida] jaroonii]|uniref:Uncharacterized protein n=1 Tax=[Candida] jaroonii TaxID=467808 RepID=A0ACA9YDH5_9ASCO|nr:hypothetical protein CLIB1444_10S00188 [[Candida] jaroonii]
MGLFSAPKGNALYYSNSEMRSHPELHRRNSNEKERSRSKSPVKEEKKSEEGAETDKSNEIPNEEITEDGEITQEAEQEKKFKKLRNRDQFDPETSKNTKLNSLIYHTSDDTVDLYTRENDSSDLIGRIYYDDFDSDSVTSPLVSVTNTPLLSPKFSALSGSSHVDYFSLSSSRLPSSTNLHTIGSATNLKASMSQTSIDDKFKNGISFDITGASDKKSLTLKVKHPKFKFRRNNKTFLCGYNDDLESLKAIKWLFDEMIIHGDTIVILQVLDEKLHNKIDKKVVNKNLFKIEELNIHNKKISIVFEVDIGKPQKLLQRAIDEYKPQMMCIGSHHEDEQQHHKSIFSKTTLGSYFLQYALVPVVIVKPKYNHITILNNEIDSIDYFKNWLNNIDISETYSKKKKRPSFNRTNSVEDRGRTLDKEGRFKFSISASRSRSTSESRHSDGSNDKLIEPIHERSTSKGRTRLSRLFHIDD